ncbi:hypothetical protein EJ110_NYTH30526 [Nymphaea thermarum]|nr:hypothetical protein EJ110_NYTH30526 [Nymphaea thermarum]
MRWRIPATSAFFPAIFRRVPASISKPFQSSFGHSRCSLAKSGAKVDSGEHLGKPATLGILLHAGNLDSFSDENSYFPGHLPSPPVTVVPLPAVFRHPSSPAPSNSGETQSTLHSHWATTLHQPAFPPLSRTSSASHIPLDSGDLRPPAAATALFPATFSGDFSSKSPASSKVFPRFIFFTGDFLEALAHGRTTMPGRMDNVQPSPEVERDPSTEREEVPSAVLETQAVGRMAHLEDEFLKMRQEMSEYKQQLSKLDEINDIKEMLRAMNANQAYNQRPAPAPPSQVTPPPRPEKNKGILGGPPSAEPTPPPWHTQAGPSRPSQGWNPEHFGDYHGTNGGHNGQHVDPTVNIGGPNGHHSGYNGNNGGQQYSTSGFGNRETYGPQASQYGSRFPGTQWENANSERRNEPDQCEEGNHPPVIEEIYETESQKEEEPPTELEQTPECEIRMMSEEERPNAMKILGWIGDKQVLVLLDSGATHNFVGEHLVDHLGELTEEQVSLRVLVANGGVLSCTRKCLDVELYLQNAPIRVDLLVVPIPSVDIILGVKWLKTIGRTWWDFSTMEMCLPKEGGGEEILKAVDPNVAPRVALRAVTAQRAAA